MRLCTMANIISQRDGRKPWAKDGENQRTSVVPQLGGKGFQGLASCILDCRDSHPTWTASRCNAACRASEIGSGGGPSNPTNRALSIAGCWT